MSPFNSWNGRSDHATYTVEPAAATTGPSDFEAPESSRISAFWPWLALANDASAAIAHPNRFVMGFASSAARTNHSSGGQSQVHGTRGARCHCARDVESTLAAEIRSPMASRCRFTQAWAARFNG